MVSEHASPLAVLGGQDAGGQNVHVAALAEGLARLGARVVVHTRRDDPGLAPRVHLAPGVEVNHVDAGPACPLPKDDLLPHMAAFGRALADEWATDPPDVVHAHFWMSGVAAMQAARLTGVPVAQTFHALGVVKRRHQGAADTSPPARITLERRLARAADCVIATCRDEVRELAGMDADPRRVRVVPCGVDVARFTPDGPGAGMRAGRVLAVGRLVPRKGIDDAIRAVARLPGVELTVAGGPPAPMLTADAEARRLAALARALGVADRVHLAGAVSRDEVAALMRGAAAVVSVPWYEPFGIVPLEAMACGAPVVASAVGGMLDTVVDGVTGAHVPPRRPDALADALADLLGDAERRRRLGQAGVRRARHRYAWDRVAADTLDVYESLVGSRRRLEVAGWA